GAEFRQAIVRFRSTGNWECVQERLCAGRSVCARSERRDFSRGDLWLTKAQPFVREEIKGVVPHQRTARHAAKVILTNRRPSQSLAICKPITGIERVVAKIIEHTPMKVVAAGP